MSRDTLVQAPACGRPVLDGGMVGYAVLGVTAKSLMPQGLPAARLVDPVPRRRQPASA
jgi:hypothetical protein